MKAPQSILSHVILDRATNTSYVFSIKYLVFGSTLPDEIAIYKIPDTIPLRYSVKLWYFYNGREYLYFIFWYLGTKIINLQIIS